MTLICPFLNIVTKWRFSKKIAWDTFSLRTSHSEYLRKEGLVRECSALLEIEMEQVNSCVRQVLMTAGKKHSANRGSYTDYTLEDRAKDREVHL